MIKGDGIKSVHILRQETCLKMKSKALPWTCGVWNEETIHHMRQYGVMFVIWPAGATVCNSPRMGLCSHFGRFVKRNNVTQVVIRKKKMTGYIYTHLNRKAQTVKTQKISAKIKTIIEGMETKTGRVCKYVFNVIKRSQKIVFSYYS